MRGGCVLMVSIGYAVLAHATAYGGPSDFVPQPSASRSSASTVSGHLGNNAHRRASIGKKQQTNKGIVDKQQRQRNPPEKRQPRGASPGRANRSEQLPNGRELALGGSSTGLRQSQRSRTIPAANGAPMQHESAGNAWPVRTPSVVSHAAITPNNLRHRDPNPAVIGGLANAKTGNIGGVNGTLVSRRP